MQHAGNRTKAMKTLKKLFGRSTLAATAATGMLLFSTVKALAGWYTVSALMVPYSNHETECPNSYCKAWCQDQRAYFYWCCGANWVNSCYPDHIGILLDCNPWDETLQGYCLQL